MKEANDKQLTLFETKESIDYYPNVKVVAYKGADGTHETDLDKILSNLVVGKNKYGHTTVSFDTVDKYVDISNHYMSDNTGDWVAISIANLENSKRGYYVEINVKHEENMRKVFYTALKHAYKCIIVDNEIFANILK